MKLRQYHLVIYLLVIYFSACLFCIDFSEAAQFESNLRLGTQIDTGPGKVKITKVAEATKTPINARNPKNDSNRFVVIETIVTAIDKGSTLNNIAFTLVTRKKVRFDTPGAYGKVKVFDKLSNYEATDGAVVYASAIGDSLNLFFEVPQDIRINDLRLIYDASKK